MSLLSLINILAQSLAALVIFVIGYLALLVSAIAALVLANLIYHGARLFWSRVIRPGASANGIPSKIGGNGHMAWYKVGILLAPRREASHQVAPVRRPGL